MNELTREEIILIIEALRVYQTTLERNPAGAARLAEEFGRPVTSAETVTRIEELCERLNCS